MFPYYRSENKNPTKYEFLIELEAKIVRKVPKLGRDH
jgi:hypothetical protein